MASHEIQEGELIDVILLCAMVVGVTWGATALASHFGWSAYSWNSHPAASASSVSHENSFDTGNSTEQSAGARAQRLQDMTEGLR